MSIFKVIVLVIVIVLLMFLADLIRNNTKQKGLFESFAIITAAYFLGVISLTVALFLD